MIKRKEIRVKNFTIADNQPCFVIAEIGHNHQGDPDTAKKLIEQARLCGASAVKLQKRFNKSLYTKAMYDKPYDHENSFGLTYGEHRQALEFNHNQYMELKAFAEKRGLVFFATGFDFESVDFLDAIDVPIFKIASPDITNHPLIEHVARKRKPVFMSTGTSSLNEVKEAYQIARKHTDEICIMQCTSEYPADPKNIHLNVIKTYRKIFPEAIIGYSGHDNGIVLPVVAYVLGARVIEKHFTLSRAMKGNDHKFSLEPVGLRKMVRDLSRVRDAFGSHKKRCYDFELQAKEKMGKSIVLAKDLKKGDVISEDIIVFKSPGHGVPPSRIKDILNKKVRRDMPEDTVLTFEDLENI